MVSFAFLVLVIMMATTGTRVHFHRQEQLMGTIHGHFIANFQIAATPNQGDVMVAVQNMDRDRF